MRRCITVLALWAGMAGLLGVAVDGFAVCGGSSAIGRRVSRRSPLLLLRAETEPAGAEEGGGVVGADDLLNSPAFLKKKIELLEKQLEQTAKDIEEAKAEADLAWQEWGDQTERLRGEFDFVKQRMLNDTMEAANDAKVKLLKEVLPVSDNFLRASQSIKPETEGGAAVRAHYENIYHAMQGILADLGVTEVPTVGEPFDYNLHEAIMRQASAEYDEDIVCQEFAKGFMVGDKLIRPAMVAVSMGS